MSPTPNPEALQALRLARQALRGNNRAEAERQAALAVQLDPDLEEGWLIRAALSSPSTSVVYIRKALAINPGSEHARKAMHWAVQRLRTSELAKLNLAPPAAAPAAPPPPEPLEDTPDQ